LVDKAEYVFGIDPDPPSFDLPKKRERYEQRMRQRPQLFRQSVGEALIALPGSAGLRAVASFLERETPEQVRELLRGASSAQRQELAGALFAFVYDVDGGVACVHDHPDVRTYLRRCDIITD
jgi:hypothetical protein